MKNGYIPNVPEPKQIDYLWGDNEKLNTLCKRIQDRFRKSENILTYKQYPYGFGNLYYSIVAMVAVALLGNYRLYYEYPEYNSYFDTCFSINVLSGNEGIEYEYDLPDYKTKYNFLSTYGHPDTRRGLNYLFPPANIRMGGSLMEIQTIIASGGNIRLWRTLIADLAGGIEVWKIRKMFLRLLLNPEPIMKQNYLEERKKLIVHKYTIGLQLRMGGSLANENEEYTGVPFNRIDDVIEQVRGVIKKKKWEKNVQLFISSDSSYVIDVIKNKTRNEFPVVYSQLYKRGHTELEAGKEITRNVLIDLYYMSMADHIIVTWPSSLGRLMCFVSNQKACDAVLNWWEKSKVVKFE